MQMSMADMQPEGGTPAAGAADGGDANMNQVLYYVYATNTGFLV